MGLETVDVTVTAVGAPRRRRRRRKEAEDALDSKRQKDPEYNP